MLKNLVLSKTTLRPSQQTRGHRHDGQEEIYFFLYGDGKMIVGEEDTEPFEVHSGNIIQIPDGAFHRVINTSENREMKFICVFDGKRNH